MKWSTAIKLVYRNCHCPSCNSRYLEMYKQLGHGMFFMRCKACNRVFIRQPIELMEKA